LDFAKNSTSRTFEWRGCRQVVMSRWWVLSWICCKNRYVPLCRLLRQ